jgi:hypothetical protein
MRFDSDVVNLLLGRFEIERRFSRRAFKIRTSSSPDGSGRDIGLR